MSSISIHIRRFFVFYQKRSLLSLSIQYGTIWGERRAQRISKCSHIPSSYEDDVDGCWKADKYDCHVSGADDVIERSSSEECDGAVTETDEDADEHDDDETEDGWEGDKHDCVGVSS